MPMEGTFILKKGPQVAGLQSMPTPMPMSADASTKAEIDGPTDYKDQVNGIIPGYSGHVPRARDKYAGAHTGGIAKTIGGPPPMNVGPQDGHVRPEDVLPPRFVDYVNSNKGVMPGYCGFRPESVHVKNVSAYGGIPHQGMKGDTSMTGLNINVSSDEGGTHYAQGVREFEWRRSKDVCPDPPSFRDNVGGILPGYTGHAPRATDKTGSSHYGGLSPDKPYVPWAQTGHEGYKISAPGQVAGQPGEKDVELRMIPGYQGFIPKARDAFGTTYYTKGR